MEVIMMGNIRGAIVDAIKRSLPYIEEPILKAALCEAVPERGLIIEAEIEELQRIEIGALMYQPCTVSSISKCKFCEGGEPHPECPHYGKPNGCNR